MAVKTIDPRNKYARLLLELESLNQRYSNFSASVPLSTIYPRYRLPPESLNILLHLYLFNDNKNYLLVKLIRTVYLSVIIVDNLFTSGFISVSCNLESPH